MYSVGTVESSGRDYPFPEKAAIGLVGIRGVEHQLDSACIRLSGIGILFKLLLIHTDGFAQR